MGLGVFSVDLLNRPTLVRSRLLEAGVRSGFNNNFFEDLTNFLSNIFSTFSVYFVHERIRHLYPRRVTLRRLHG